MLADLRIDNLDGVDSLGSLLSERGCLSWTLDGRLEGRIIERAIDIIDLRLSERSQGGSDDILRSVCREADLWLLIILEG